MYLIAAWGAIEVADTVFPNLGMPSWTVRLVIVLAALAFPVVVLLAWTFDLTREGIQRTDAPATETGTGSAGRRGRGRTALLAGASLIALAGLGLWWTSFGEEETLDDGLIAVMPFRVAGADPSLGYLREGLMDLLAATLTGRDGVPAAVSPRTLAQVLRERIGSLDADPSAEQALDIARIVGAGRVLEGEVVGSATHLTVSTRLYDASDGHVVTRTSFPLHADSLHRIVDRITATMIAAEAGLSEDRLASVTTTSLPALRAYIEGSHAFRRGDHFGAVHAWDRALDIDSTFALAGLGLSRAQGWTIVAGRHSDQAFEVAWRGREQLGEADRVVLDAMRPRHPLLPTYPELIAARREAVERFPRDPDLRFLLGDGYLHYGPAAGIENPLEMARAQLVRVVAADSTHLETVIHLYDIAQEMDDTVAMREYGDLLLAVDSASPHAIKVLYDRAPETIDLDTLGAPALLRTIGKGWLGELDSASVDAIWRALDREQDPMDRRLLSGLSTFAALWEGRPSRYWQLVERNAAYDQSPADRLLVALFAVEDSTVAGREARAVERRILELESDQTDPSEVELVFHQCMLAHWEAGRGASSAAEHLASELARRPASRQGPPTVAAEQELRNTALLCADLVRTTMAVGRGAVDAAERLAAVDARLAAGIRIAPPYHEAASLHVARLWRALDRPERALASVRRRVALVGYVNLHVESLGEEARVLDDLGRREEAIRMYVRVLDWRARAEGVFAERAARDRQRLATLVGERS